MRKSFLVFMSELFIWGLKWKLLSASNLNLFFWRIKDFKMMKK